MVNPRMAFECPTAPIVTVIKGGRLGNQIMEYASACLVAKALNRTAYVPEAILSTLKPIFPNLTFTTSFEDMCQQCKINVELNPLSNDEIKDLCHLNHPEIRMKYESGHIVLKRFISLRRLINKNLEDFRHEFTFRQEILEEAQKTMEKFRKQGTIFVCVHVRRTDYSRYFAMRRNNGSLVDASFFKNAMQWYRDKYPVPLMFLVVSDDVKWCEENLLDKQDVKIASKGPAHDLAIMSICNHTIIDYGTFGLTGAFLSKGYKVVLDRQNSFLKPFRKFQNWEFLPINIPN